MATFPDVRESARENPIMKYVALVAVVVASALWLAGGYSAEDSHGPPGKPPRGTQPQERPIDTSKLPRGTVVFHGGHQTDARDGGRPVVLVAAALGVEPQVFRDAFKNVHPAHNGPPSPERARANKAVLMAALGKYGVTNERLDEVSNYYRYRPQNGELWKHAPAEATATIEHGKVTGVKLTRAGAGYSSPPRVEVVGYPEAHLTATLEYGTTLETNGHVKTLHLAD